MKRMRQSKIVATLGPASSDAATIGSLFAAGADVFRLNFSHGTHAQHRERLAHIRAMERDAGRPVAVLADLQGPKLRIGALARGPVMLEAGASFRLDLDNEPGDPTRAPLPHPEIFAALTPGAQLLLDDGKLRLEVIVCGPEFARTRVIVGGPLSERKGVNVPSVVLPLSALTDKDRTDLDFALEQGVDWIALSFVQRAADVEEVQRIVAGRARVLAKIEKPAAIAALESIVAASDAVMVARGDLGVELPAEQVPIVQKRIVRACRAAGKPVVVATQMLESMITAPVPTRAEASDVANAVYEGADAVMLSAESASGRYPREAVAMMDRVIREVESDPEFRRAIDASGCRPPAAIPDAICLAMRDTAGLLPVAGIVTYTRSGATSLRAARERPGVPVLSLTPDLGTARQLALVWGVHSIHDEEHVPDVPQIAARACAVAQREAFAAAGDIVVIASGMPFGVPGTTNFLHIARV
jgi:pyruvate kinase